MSYAHERLDGFTADWITVVLVGITAAFQGLAIALVHKILTLSFEQPEQSADITIGVDILAIAAVEIGAILLLWRGYKRLPEHWQQRVKTVLKYGGLTVGYYLGLWMYWVAEQTWVYILGVPLLVAVFKLFGNSDFKWIAFNLVAFGLGVFIVTTASFSVAPVVVLVLMVAFMIYDHVAVNLTDIMGDLVEMSASVGIPNFIVIPNQIRFDLDAVKEYMTEERDEKPESVAFMIGVGDFVFPALLTVSTFITGAELAAGGAFIGTLVATVVLRDSLERAESGLPALPWLNTGAIGGFIIGAVASSSSILVVLGL